MERREIYIPKEIKEFFEIKGNSTLLVKGEAGTGKTLFSLECLKELADPKCGLYFSTRTNVEALLSQYPRISEFIPMSNIIDATLSRITLGSKEMPELFIYDSIPDFLRYLYVRVKELSEKGNVVVVLDSFDAVCDAIGIDMEKASRQLIEFVKNTNIKLVIVLETGEKSYLDYMADGVILLERIFEEGKVYRELKILKLRGVEVRAPVVPFTLHGGMFRSFNKLTLTNAFVLKEEDLFKMKDSMMEVMRRFGTDIGVTNAYSRTFGKLGKKNFIVCIEFEGKMTSGIYEMNNLIVLNYALSKRYGNIIVVEKYADEDVILKEYTTFFKGSGNLIKVVSLKSGLDNLLNAIEEFKRLKLERLVVLVPLDGLGREIDEREFLDKLLECLADQKSVLVFILDRTYNREFWTSISDFIVSYRDRYGFLLVYGKVPKTEYYGVTFDGEGKNINMLPIF
ncbi:MAG: RAD55 family ATPase [Candidatus Asgardarchaeia archaeon]